MANPDAVVRTLDAVRERAPLVHNITNAVVTNTTANALLAIGASPAMVESVEEVADFVALADALVVNLGTLTPESEAAMRRAVARAAERGKPWVLDPVAVGVLGNRLRLAAALLQFRPSVVRGNASEIMALAGAGAGGKGVDSGAESDAALGAAQALAGRAGVVVAVTGAVDYVTDGARTLACRNGHPMMTRVTGLGCTATALVGACIAVERDALAAAAHGLALTGVAGEIAAARSRGPGSLQMEFLDALHALNAATLRARVRLTDAS
ncbi:MAG: hydroxyethylthiazole kinase [Acidisphaera sp.]|nr:hydroxyethylthiazole kinase [Acidisphaera sp.]MBV9811952.1 hydroxyethylthiazole kinase [Acetobacteraceae bacterium]